MKRLISLCITAAVAASLCACGSKQDTAATNGTNGEAPVASAETSTEGQESKSGKKTQLRWMNIVSEGSDSYQLYQDAIKKFNENNDKYEIVSDTPSDLGTKLLFEYSAGTGPAISWSLTAQAKKLTDSGLIVNWSDIYGKDYGKNFTTWFTDQVRSYSDFGDGTLMMLPNEASVDGLFYNKTLFEKYGWKLPETFDDLISLAEEVQKEGYYLLSAGGAENRWAWLMSQLMVRTGGIDSYNHLTYGEGLKDWADPQYGYPQALEKFKQLVDAGAYYPGTVGMMVNEADTLFCTEKVVMYYEGSWKPGNWKNIVGEEWLNANVGVMSFPAMTDMEKGDPEAIIGGTLNGWIINESLSDEEKQACCEFLESIVSPDFYKGIIESGSMLYTGKVDYDREKAPEATNMLYDRFQSGVQMAPSMDCVMDQAMLDAVVNSVPSALINDTMTVEEAVNVVAQVGQESYEDYMASK